MTFFKQAISVICAGLLLIGCNNPQSQNTIETPPAATSGGEDEFGPIEDTALEELPLVATPTVERNTSPTARSVRISVGEAAPFSGSLLADEARSYLYTSSTSLESECTAAILRQRDRDAARLSLNVGELRLQMSSDRERFRVILEGRDREISRLLELNAAITRESDSFPWETLLIGVGAAALGIVIGFVSGVVYSP